MKRTFAIALISCFVLQTPAARAHFHMLFPDDKPAAQPGDKVKFTYRWGHPFEHELFDATKPVELIVISPAGEKSKLTDLEEFKVPAGKNKVTAHRFVFEPRGTVAERVGDYVFALTTPQVFMKDEEVILEDTVKVVLHVQAQKGWDQVVGLPFELVPLTRPYGLKPGMVFQAQALFKDKPLAGAMVEVERYNEVPPKELPPEEHRTRAVKTDPNGILTCTLPDAGWWCITAYRDGGKAGHAGKNYPLQQRTTFWVYVDR